MEVNQTQGAAAVVGCPPPSLARATSSCRQTYEVGSGSSRCSTLFAVGYCGGTKYALRLLTRPLRTDSARQIWRMTENNTPRWFCMRYAVDCSFDPTLVFSHWPTAGCLVRGCVQQKISLDLNGMRLMVLAAVWRAKCRGSSVAAAWLTPSTPALLL